MRVVALMTVRNEADYLARTLTHLEQQGVEVCLIDNGSVDASRKIAESFGSRNVCRIESLPYDGVFSLARILQNEERLAREIDADWFLHHDADEIREAPAGMGTLAEAFKIVQDEGFNAVAFDEFVFLPTDRCEDHAGRDFVAEMVWYYFHEPAPLHHVKAWRRAADLDLVSDAGHHVRFAGIRIFPQKFVLRHYIALSVAHVIRKYAGRVYDTEEFDRRGWHGARLSFAPEQLTLPDRATLKQFDGHGWDRSDPRKGHSFLGVPKPLPRVRPNSLLRAGPVAPAPFIVGVMRSGTTLLRLMLDRHSDLAIPPETRFLPALCALQEEGRESVDNVLSVMTTSPTWNDFGLGADELARALTDVQPFTTGGGLEAFYRLYAGRFGKQRWGEKTPLYMLYMPQIEAMLPQARFIHLIRDGRDVAVSLRGLWFGLGDTPEATAATWMCRIKQARQLGQQVGHYLEVRFEALVTNPEAELRRICDFVELSFEPALLTYFETAEKRLAELSDRVNDEGQVALSGRQWREIFDKTRLPPQEDRIGRWRHEMAPEALRSFHAVAGLFLRDLGYEVPPDA